MASALAVLEDRTHPVLRVITHRAGPLDYRIRTEDGASSQMWGLPGALASHSLLQDRGQAWEPRQLPSRAEQDRVTGVSGRTPGGGSQVLRQPCSSPGRVNSPSIRMNYRILGQ